MSYAGLVFTLATVLTQSRLEQRHPLTPWHPLNSSAYVWAVNTTPDSLTFTAQAPDVDTAVRVIGRVAPRDSALLRLPYADTDVLVSADGTTVKLHITKPGYWRVP